MSNQYVGPLVRARARDISPTGSERLTPAGAAKFLGLPGPWTVRRLEARGTLPPAPRSLAHGDRYYDPATLVAMRRQLHQARQEGGDGGS